MRTMQKVRILIILCSFLLHTNCNSMKQIRKMAPWATIAAILMVGYNAYLEFFKISKIDGNVAKVKGDVQDLKMESQEIKRKIQRVREQTAQIIRETQAIKEQTRKINEKLKERFQALEVRMERSEQETKKDFTRVHENIAETKDSLVQELDNKEQVLTQAIEQAKDQMKQEVKDSSDLINSRLRVMQREAKEFSKKEDVKILQELLGSLGLKISNMKPDCTACIKASEASLKRYMKDLLDKVQERQEEKQEVRQQEILATLKTYVEKFESLYVKFANQDGEN